MNPKSVRFSSKHGYSITWHEPDSFQINSAEAIYIMAGLKADLSAEELESSFTWDERETIYRYTRKRLENFRDEVIRQEDKVNSLKSLQRGIKDLLQRNIAFLGMEIEDYLRDGLGWPELDKNQIRINREFKKGLDHIWYGKDHYERLLKQYGRPSPEILAKVEARVGPLPLE